MTNPAHNPARFEPNMLPIMGWLEDLTKPMVGRVWQAFFGFGYEMKVTICERPHVLVYFGGPVAMPRHLHVDLMVWNKGGPDRTVISWQPTTKNWYTVTDSPKGAIVLESSGKPVRLRWLLEPQDSNQPFEFKVGDTFVMKLILNNGTPQHFKAKVTQ